MGPYKKMSPNINKFQNINIQSDDIYNNNVSEIVSPDLNILKKRSEKLINKKSEIQKSSKKYNNSIQRKTTVSIDSILPKKVQDFTKSSIQHELNINIKSINDDNQSKNIQNAGKHKNNNLKKSGSTSIISLKNNQK